MNGRDEFGLMPFPSVIRVLRSVQESERVAGVVGVVELKYPEVTVTVNGRGDIERKAILRGGGNRALIGAGVRSVQIHADNLILLVNVNIRRSDVIFEGGGLDQMNRHGFMNTPRAGKFVGVSQPDELTLVMRKIEVVFPERVFHPGGHPNKRGGVDFFTESG